MFTRTYTHAHTPTHTYTHRHFTSNCRIVSPITPLCTCNSIAPFFCTVFYTKLKQLPPDLLSVNGVRFVPVCYNCTDIVEVIDTLLSDDTERIVFLLLPVECLFCFNRDFCFFPSR